MNILWLDRTSKINVLEQAKMASFEAIVIKNQLRWNANLVQMDDNRLKNEKHLLPTQRSKSKKRGGVQRRDTSTF